MSRARVGFVGVGSIGRPMAERLLDAGWPLVVHDVSEAALAQFRGRARVADAPREVGDEAEIVFSCLPSATSSLEVVGGAEGLAAGAVMRCYVHTGTTGEPVVARLAGELAEGRVAFVDAPITGGVPRAWAGALTAIVSGPREVVDDVSPCLRAFANKVVVVGDRPGDAQRMKLVNNVLSAGNLALACEALVLGRKAGLDPETMLEVINSGSGQNSATLTKIPEHVLPRRFDRGGAIELLLKDLREVTAEAERLGVEVPLGDAVRRAFEQAVEEGSAVDDSTSVIRHMELRAGLEPE